MNKNSFFFGQILRADGKNRWVSQSEHTVEVDHELSLALSRTHANRTILLSLGIGESQMLQKLLNMIGTITAPKFGREPALESANYLHVAVNC